MYISDNVIIKISKIKLEINNIKNILISSRCGANVSFCGTIKKVNNYKKVNKIEYKVFKQLAYSVLITKCLNYTRIYDRCKIYIYQYYGFVSVKETNIIVVVSSVSRYPAFLLCGKIIDFIKREVPIWKKEYYADFTHNWININ